ncbi:hypothetical protein ACFS5J_08320 [Flavobacterium chuncheonense]|uniref:Uncharacterized protein n=1 Tax=Flavobacterium chuncheonense TaxID=2026653 RepID=A0ABW5YLP0_9FLAO
MKNIISIIFFLFFTLLINHSANSQSDRLSKNYSSKDFEKNKVFDQTYNLWQYKNKLFPNKNDTLPHPYFVDDRNYKGIINYGIKFRSKDYRNFDFIENHYMYFLKIDFEKVLFNSKDSIIEIEGYVSGGWGDLVSGKKESSIENKIDVFLGRKEDTIKKLYYSRVVNEEFIEVTLNNQLVDQTTILDSFPAFYFENYSHFRTKESKRKRFFKIKGKITSNTLLAFGGRNCYAEIFDIGSMVFYPNKNKRKKIKNEKKPAYKTLIANNVLLSKKEEVKEVNYYTYTKEAENYIIKRQYAKAKEQYLALHKKYPILFARDLHNAIRCAVFSRDYENAFYWAEKIAKKGVSINYFNAKVLVPLKRNKQWDSFSEKYDSIYNEFQNNKNTKLKQEIEKLVNEDQADYGLANRKGPKILFETTERVTDKLIALLKNEGYPSEEKIGVYTKNDTILIQSPEFQVLIRHAIQQNPKNLDDLKSLLDIAIKNLEYDNERSANNILFNNSCFHIYKGNLYNSKSCGDNELMVGQMKFMFNNPYNFIIHNNNFIVTEYNKENPEEYDTFYKEQFNFIMKLTDDWEFYLNN